MTSMLSWRVGEMGAAVLAAEVLVTPACENAREWVAFPAAPRIFYRLSMWSSDLDDRAVTPMPPMAALAVYGVDDAGLRYSAELKTLRDYARRLYESESSGAGAEDLLSRDYAKLGTCITG